MRSIVCRRRHSLPQFDQAISLHSASLTTGSTDGTAAILRWLNEQEPERIATIDLPKNRGKAEAVRTGMLHFSSRPGCSMWKSSRAASGDSAEKKPWRCCGRSRWIIGLIKAKAVCALPILSGSPAT